MGWRSIELDLHLKTIKIMQEQYKSDMKDIEVLIGPSIKVDSYILKNPSQKYLTEWNNYLEETKIDYYKINLNQYIVDGIKKLGIKKINNSDIDTGKDLNFFSHYRSIYLDKNEIEGRFLCGVILEDNEKNT